MVKTKAHWPSAVERPDQAEPEEVAEQAQPELDAAPGAVRGHRVGDDLVVAVDAGAQRVERRLADRIGRAGPADIADQVDVRVDGRQRQLLADRDRLLQERQDVPDRAGEQQALLPPNWSKSYPGSVNVATDEEELLGRESRSVPWRCRRTRQNSASGRPRSLDPPGGH